MLQYASGQFFVPKHTPAESWAQYLFYGELLAAGTPVGVCAQFVDGGVPAAYNAEKHGRSMEDLDFASIGALRGVHYTADEDWARAITEVALVFDRTTLIITVNADEDTISLSTDESNTHAPGNTIADRHFDELTATLLSKSVLWFWELTNQQGYRDGVQLEFADGKAGAENDVIVQFVAAASAIRVYVVRRVA